MPQTWHFSYSAAPLCSGNPSGDSITVFDPPSLPCLTHNPLVHLQGVIWIVQHPFLSLTVPWKAQIAAPPQLPSLLWSHGHVQDRQRKKGIQYPLTFPSESRELKLFPVPKILSQVMMTNSVFLTHTERKCALLYITSVCWTSFIPVGHVLYRNEPSTELFCGKHPKILCCPLCNRSQNTVCHWSILDVAQREQFQAVYSMDEKTLCTVVQARSPWKASEQNESQTTEIR